MRGNAPTLAKGSRIAVVGSGISGLSAAWLLSPEHQVTLFESGDYFGGHSNTVDVTLEGQTYPVDTGFLVHNDLTYPNLIELFRTLGVAVHASDMSFGVSIDEPDIEWAGTNLDTVFAQRSNLLRPSFLGMLKDIVRFNKHAQDYLNKVRGTPCTLGELLLAERYGLPMQHWYLLPMAAAIWSSPVKDILGFPAQTFLTFCLNHRLLQIENRPQWKTVLNGSRTYVQAMLASIPDARLRCPVQRVRRHAQSIEIVLASGTEHFDAVVMACHAPTTLSLIDAHEDEMKVLGGFRYQPNQAILHTDRSLLPRREKVWSAWNYLSSQGQSGLRPVAVSYLLNKLQPLPFKMPVIVTLNPHRPPDPASVIQTFEYEHPVMDMPAMASQRMLGSIQGVRRTWFCGAWAGYGFHEDGLKSALHVARDMGITPPWSARYD